MRAVLKLKLLTMITMLGLLSATGMDCPPSDNVNTNNNNNSNTNGDGGIPFQEPLSFSVSTVDNYIVNMRPIVADFNADQKPDLVISQTQSSAPPANGVSVAFGNGDGTFDDGIESTFTGQGFVASVGDFNDDGRADIMRVIDLDGHRWEVSLSNGDGTFDSTELPIDVNLPTLFRHSYPVADYNNNGTNDVLIQTDETIGNCSEEPPPEILNKLVLLQGDGLGGFGAPQEVDTELPADCGGGGRDTSGDVNGDGIVDRISPVGNRIVAQLGTGANGTVGDEIATTPTADEGMPTNPIAIGDIDGDGNGDLAGYLEERPNTGDTIVVFTSNGDGTFTFSQALTTTDTRGSRADGIGEVQILDFNGDGHNDIIAVTGGQNSPVFDAPNVGFAVFLGDGAGGFGAESTFVTDRLDYVVFGILDLNGDDKLDLMLGVQRGNRVDVFLQE